MKNHVIPCFVWENALVISLEEEYPTKAAFSGLWKSGFLLFILLMSDFGVFAQVSAGFTVNVPVPNCNPAVYSFTNNSSGIAPLTYQWNFGVYPGVNSIFQNPGTTYLACGTYTVKLVVTNGIGQQDSTTQTVNIRCSPDANFTVSNISGCVPYSTNFTSTSTPGSGTISGYLWDFGDGYNGAGANPGHTYNVSGCKNVTLIVTNSFNCVHDTTINNLVCTFARPIASFTSSPAFSCTAPLSVAYQSTSDSGLAPYTYQWIFQGGAPAASHNANPNVTYTKPGIYTTTLIISDAKGCSDTLVKTGYVTIPVNTADFTLSAAQGCVNTVITANGISSGTPATWKWTVTPSATISNDTSQDVSFTFADSGTYNVCLTINYGAGCVAQKCSTVVIHPGPSAYYTVNGILNTCVKPDAIAFTDSSTGTGLSYNWSFPGGVPSTDNTPTPPVINYNTCGQYSASLIVTDSFGCTSTFNTSNFLTITCPAAWFTILPSIGCSPLTTSFNSNTTTGNPVAWSWNFGDTLSGSADTSSFQNPTHTYDYPGCYTIILIATNAQGCIYSDTIPAGVCTGHRPHANFSGNPPVNCANLPVYFTDSSTNTYSYTTYVWDFHGGPPYFNESTLQNPTYIYNDTGYKNISLIVSNYGCADTLTKDDLINIKGPVAIPKVTASCSNPTVVLDGTPSFDAQHYFWFLPGGNPSSDSSAIVTVTYPGTGTYTATLSVTNDTTGCSYVTPVSFQINNVQAQFTGSPLSGCAPLNSCLSNTSNDARNCSWVVSDSLGNIVAISNNFSQCFTLNNVGVYNVLLIVSDTAGCADTLYRPKYIRVNNPIDDFQGAPVSGCAPLKVNFSDLSSSSTSTISDWNWNFGDNSGTDDTSSLQNPVHIYNTIGSYTVSLQIGDNMGCTKNTSKVQYITVSNLATSFTSSITNSCQGTQACFTIDTTGPGLNYDWSFGDGATSAIMSPCHNYTASGAFAVKLVASNVMGCIDSSTIVTNVSVSRPHAVFVADTTHTSCPPLQVSFSNLSTAITPQSIYYWQFGDGQVSSAQAPTHIYSIAGTFDVSLIVTNPNGCRDTLLFPQYIHVGGPTAFISIPPTSGCVPHSTCFEAISNSTISFTWNYGDGKVIVAGSTTCYTYVSTGTFYPQLILNDGAGCVYGMPVGAVSVGGAVTDFIMDYNTICSNGTVHFTDSTYGISPVQSWLWDFGDPASGVQDAATLKNPSHFYTSPGTYQVTLKTASYDGCSDTASKTVTVTSPPSAIFAESTPAACSKQTVQFTDETVSSSPVISQLWNFGDPSSGAANTSAMQNPSHNYTIPGAYTVTLTEVADNGCSDSSSAAVVVNQSPVAAFAAFDTCLNTQPVLFKNNSRYANYYQWSFGDGNSSAQVDPSHSYTGQGIYAVQLIAQNSLCSDTFGSPVKIYPMPNASFLLSANDLCGPPFSLNVQNTSNGAIDYQWNFGNKITSTDFNPVISYQSPGQYVVSLQARNTYLCADTSAMVVNAYQKAIASFTAFDTCLNTQPIVFNNTSQFANQYVWNYGDGNSSTLSNPSYTYSDSGVFEVTLIAANNSCRDTFSSPVKVYQVPDASFLLASGYLCGPPAMLSINNTSTGATNYLWDFGNSTSSTGVSPIASYSLPGQYVISLIARNAYQCQDTATRPFVVYPYPVIDSINIQPAAGCKPLKVNVIANVTNGNTFTWDFGDHTAPVISNSPTATYIYPDTGVYTISLQVISFMDCGDTVVLTDTIKVHVTPLADFNYTLNTNLQPENGTVLFINQSENADSYLWNFGDGDTSSAINPSHLFPEVNTFEVKLVAENKFGCADSITKSIQEIKKTLYVPDAFAPDFVGGSDLVKVWQPVGIGLLTYHAQVFDKWGELLWESTALTPELMPAEGWDGTYQGKICQQDVYVWKIDAVFVDGTRWNGMSYNDSPKKTIGSVTLIR